MSENIESTTKFIHIGSAGTAPIKIISIPVNSKPTSVVDFRQIKKTSFTTLNTPRVILSKSMMDEAKAAFTSKPSESWSVDEEADSVESPEKRKKLISRAAIDERDVAYNAAQKTSRPRKNQRKPHYAYVTDSEDEAENTKKLKLSEKEVLMARRSKRESLSQKLAEWGLLPSKAEDGSELRQTYSDDDDPDAPVINPTRFYPVTRPVKVFRHEETEIREPEILFASAHKSLSDEVKIIEKVGVLKEKNSTVEMINKSLMCKPIMLTKATVCNPARNYKSCQTDFDENKKKKIKIVTLPVPMVMPLPVIKMPLPISYPVPTPVPIPVPCILPLTKKAVGEIMKKLQTIHDEMMDPLEKNLLEMADALADTKTEEDIHKEQQNANIVRTICYRPKKTISLTNQRYIGGAMGDEAIASSLQISNEIPELQQVYDRSSRAFLPESARTTDASSNVAQTPNDTRLKLKYSFAVRAWKDWAIAKNRELNSATPQIGKSKIRFYNEELLQCSFDEIRAGLAAFVLELRKPDGSKYCPDSIYFLCLGLQYYLLENRRSDNIFNDVAFSKFSDNLNELLTAFQIKINPQNMLICRVTEEHLWEARVLGVYSPMSLITTLIYLNTKNFGLHTAESHLMLSFVDIQRVSEVVDGRKVNKLILHRTDPKLKLEITSEMHEQPNDPIKCPVKIFDFYLSKCPEMVRHSTRVFYLTPEMTCRPENESWFTVMAMSRNNINKIINRNRVVREVQISRLQMMQYT